jgi:hypothetical protein
VCCQIDRRAKHVSLSSRLPQVYLFLLPSPTSLPFSYLSAAHRVAFDDPGRRHQEPKGFERSIQSKQLENHYDHHDDADYIKDAVSHAL